MFHFTPDVVSPLPDIFNVRCTNWQGNQVRDTHTLFPNMRLLAFDMTSGVTSVAINFPSKLRLFMIQDNAIDFSESSFPVKVSIKISCHPLVLSSIDTIVPLLSTESNLDINIMMPGSHGFDEYCDALAHVIANHRGTGQFRGFFPAVGFQHSKPRLAALVNQNFTFEFSGATDEEMLMFVQQPIQETMIAMLSARHVERVAFNSSIKKLPRDIIRQMSIFFN